MGMLAAAISATHEGATYGVLLTASHNPQCDNGVKLVAPDGEMLSYEWETVAQEIANTPSSLLLQLLGQRFPGQRKPARIAVGRDNRPTGENLLSDVIEGARRLNAEILDVGRVTTPEFHTAVVRLQGGSIADLPALEPLYINEIISAFRSIVVDCGERKPIKLVVDAANGIGAEKTARVAPLLTDLGIDLRTVNAGEGILNEGCGADHVKISNSPPALGNYAPDPMVHYASFDGDADRVIFFMFSGGGAPLFHILDGDRISALCAKTMIQLVRDAGVDLRIGVVQTAYANGGSTAYLKGLGIDVVCTSTGVKHLHTAAHKFEIGIYFEANGHGTVIFQPEALRKLEAAKGAASKTILALSKLANQLVGDALSDLLLVEAMLFLNEMDMNSWLSLYTDLPSKQLKVPVTDRELIMTTDADRRIARPEKLQESIDNLLKRHPGSRAFARPSGTEDIVRVFAEAPTQTDADSLAQEIAKEVASHTLKE